MIPAAAARLDCLTSGNRLAHHQVIVTHQA